MVSLWTPLAATIAVLWYAMRDPGTNGRRAPGESKRMAWAYATATSAAPNFPAPRGKTANAAAGCARTGLLKTGLLDKMHSSSGHGNNGQGQRRLDRPHLEVVKVGDIDPVRIVSIGQAKPEHTVTEELLDAPGFRIATIENYRGLFALASDGAPDIAVIHETPDWFVLEGICATLRHEWPQARILVIHDGEEFLDDALYDERLTVNANAMELRAKLLEIVRWLDLWRFEDGGR
jgi:hypothetical protein